MCKARTRKCLRETLNNDKNGQNRMNDEGEQWSPIEGEYETCKHHSEVLYQCSSRPEKG